MENTNKLNSQIPVKNALDLKNDYILITAQDKNIQKDYIIEGQELINIISKQVQQEVFAKIKSTNSTVVTQYGDSLWITYDDTMLRDLIVRNAQQVGQIADMFNNFDATEQIQEEVAIGLAETNNQLQVLTSKVEVFQELAEQVQVIVDEISGLDLENTLQVIKSTLDNLQASLNVIENEIHTLKTTVTTAVSDEIKRYYDDALGYIDQQIEFSQTTILEE